MERNINVAKILKGKSKGTKLYSSAFGQMTYNGIAYDTNGTKIWLLTENKVDTLYLSDGKYREGGEITLYPSKEMHDWNKFTWKKGDVLVSNDSDCHIIFEGFSKDDYTTFEGKHWAGVSVKRYISCLDAQDTQDYHIEDDKNATKIYINTIEERLGGKLNRETLEIEKQQEFKDGDIVVTDAVPDMCYSKCIFILKGGLNVCEYHANSYVFYNINNNRISFDIVDRTIRDRNIHLATVEERLKLFDALTKEGKYWDAEKKEIVDLKPKIELKPFDKIVGFEELSEQWVCDMFSHYSKNYEGKEIITALGGCTYIKALPYNEDTAKLIGTSDDWEG